MSRFCVKTILLGLAVGMASSGSWLGALAQTEPPAARAVTLESCIQAALLGNHALQIQRLNPAIARHTLNVSRGYYDPIFTADVRRESIADSGGFDPADLSRDAIYDADSDEAKLGLTGVLPSGLRYTALGSYANSYGHRNLLDFDSYNLNAGISIQQPLLRNFWTDQGRTTIQINKQNLKITELGVAYLTMDIINQVQQAYYELLAARDHFRVQERLIEMREQFLAGVKRQVEVGVLTAPDVHLAESQLAVAQGEAITASNLVTLAENALKNLMGDEYAKDMSVPLVPAEQLIVVPRFFDLPRSWQDGLRQRSDLAQLRQDVLKADIDLKYRRNQLFPSLDLVAGYGRRGASTIQTSPGIPANASFDDAFSQVRHGDNPNDMVGVIFTLPLGRVAERASFRNSQALKTQAELLVKQREHLVLREISDAFNTARAGLERVQATGKAAKYAQDALTAEERKLAGGKSTLFFVLQLQRDLSTAQATEIRAKADYNKAVSQLEFAEASLLSTHRITFE